MEIVWRVEVKVSDSAGATDGDAGVVDGAVDGATACDGTACDGAMACDGATLVAVEQPATTATTSRIETSMMNETRFIGCHLQGPAVVGHRSRGALIADPTTSGRSRWRRIDGVLWIQAHGGADRLEPGHVVGPGEP